MDVMFQQKDTHLVAICGGNWGAQEVPKMLLRIREEAERRHCDKVLMDGFAVPPPPTPLDKMVAEEQFSSILGPSIKVAFIYSTELTNKMAKDAAAKDETFRVFDSEYEALDWLLVA